VQSRCTLALAMHCHRSPQMSGTLCNASKRLSSVELRKHHIGRGLCFPVRVAPHCQQACLSSLVL
jgi:hypothetical protein